MSGWLEFEVAWPVGNPLFLAARNDDATVDLLTILSSAVTVLMSWFNLRVVHATTTDWLNTRYRNKLIKIGWLEKTY